jgi:hypothetical protein
LSSFSPKKTNKPRNHEGSGKDQINDEKEVPGITMFKKRRKNHRPVGCEKIEQDMAHENKETDLVITPEVRTSRYLCEDPTEEERIERDQ